MKVGIYHPFNDFPDNYSLSHVVKEQMLMLTEHDIETHFITSKGFNSEVPENVFVHDVLTNKGYEDIIKSVGELLRPMDYVFTHDVVYLSVYKEHAKALHLLYHLTKYLHWIHSAPNPNDKRKPIPNSRYIGMNYTDLPLLAQQFQVPVGKCRVVYNSVSPDIFFDWHPFTKYLVKKHNLLDCDILITYPFDMGRFTAKGGYKIIRLIQKLCQRGKNAKVIFVNASANTKKRREEAKINQLPSNIFTSLEDEQYETVVPRQVVRELFQISNVFPLLSISEGCSLTLLEAGLCKNLIILNEDFPPMREFGELDKTLYMKTSSTRAKTKYNPSEDKYYEDWANIIIEHVESNKVLSFNRKVIQRFNRDWIWRNQLEPLLT